MLRPIAQPLHSRNHNICTFQAIFTHIPVMCMVAYMRGDSFLKPCTYTNWVKTLFLFSVTNHMPAVFNRTNILQHCCECAVAAVLELNRVYRMCECCDILCMGLLACSIFCLLITAISFSSFFSITMYVICFPVAWLPTCSGCLLFCLIMYIHLPNG